ncbi:MAG: carboxypeptidase regulatory-like domain-containing protein, partial [Thaumarchaeota archaeon]|nr:carboxypeptidase regulatory-like domain-containing protein [Nitrososphaerota archaeon]
MKTFFVAAASLLLALVSVCAQAQETPSLTQLQFDIVGARLAVDPPTLTVPKNIPTQINTFFDFPDGVSQEVKDQVLGAFVADAEVEAELRGPSFAPRRVRARPGQPLPVPAFALQGDYFLDNIRLVKNGQALLDATPSTVPITVIGDILITSVKTSPLSLDELRKKGIVIDASNFQVLNFELAFDIQGIPSKLRLLVALPNGGRPGFGGKPEELLRLRGINQQLAETVKLPPEFDRPGLNFGIAAIPFLRADEEENSPFPIPPIVGLVLIPGNIGFLNQFFSVQLLVMNAAPDGTPLVLREAQAKITLPPGLDQTPGTYDKPGDDPLRLARIEGVGQQPLAPVVQRGPDGALGTADDLPSIPPQHMGEGEFLVEGLREGAHTFDIEIHAKLHGLPSGPVALVGTTVGAVYVRNPTFALTLGHPRTVRTGERYDLYATITNTSLSPANLVSLTLDKRAVFGAQLLSDDTVLFETIASGQSATGKFSLRAQRTGEVTFSQLTTESGLTSRFILRTGVDERGVPLSPGSFILPYSATLLPTSLIDAAQRVLGQALGVAAAPPEGLPPGVLGIRSQTVRDHALELGEAGQRVEFGEPLPRVLQDLLLDWLGARNADAGFDQLLRTTEAGENFLLEVGAILKQAVMSSSVLDFQRDFAQAVAARSPHLSAITGLSNGAAPVTVEILDALGRVTAESGPGSAATLPYAGLSPLIDDSGGQSDLAVVGRVNASRYTVVVNGFGSGRFDLGVVIPAGLGRLTQLRYEDVAIDTNGAARVVIDLTTAGPFFLEVDRNGDGVIDQTVAPTTVEIVEAPPHLIRVQQIAKLREIPWDWFDPAPFGILIGVLFDKLVTKETAETQANYTIDANAVLGAALQPSERLVYLYLERPVGKFVARSLTAAGIADARNNLLAPVTAPIHTVLDNGAQVAGQVLTADGNPVSGALLDLSMPSEGGSFRVARVLTDARGAYAFDFVVFRGTGDNFDLVAQHPVSLKFTSLRAFIRAPGQILKLDLVFQGAGTVRGRVLASDGKTPVPEALVHLIPSPASLSFSGNGGSIVSLDRKTGTNAQGEYVFTDVPVGTYGVKSVAGGVVGQATGVVEADGQESVTDIYLIDKPPGALTGRVFLSDGATPAIGFPVYVGDLGPAGILAVAQATTDAAGSFTITDLLARGGYDVVAVDPATGQRGKVRNVDVPPGVTTSVSIIMEALGNVEGVVRDAQGRLVDGALVAGGFALGKTDVNGHFRIEGVLAGLRTIEAGNPRTKRRGSVPVTVLPGQTVLVAITLEARATIIGQVLDASGNPVPRASVRIPRSNGFFFVIANLQGVFRFPEIHLSDYLLQAPGPDWPGLVQAMIDQGMDPRSAFTAGDIPENLGGPLPSTSDPNAVLDAYARAVQTFFSSTSIPEPLPIPAGGFGWNKVRLFEDSVTVTADIKYLPQGTVSGMTVDGNGSQTGAVVRALWLRPDSGTGRPIFAESGRLNSDPQTGAFSFSGVTRFDLPTFQAVGIEKLGDFRLEAVTPFSPVHISYDGQLNVNTPNQSGIVLQFPSASETNGTIGGRVFLPDGVTPAPEGTAVRISFGDLTVTTDAEGRFDSLLPIPASPPGGQPAIYTVTAEEPVSGMKGQTLVDLPAGAHVDVQIRLLGLGTVTVVVQRTDGRRVPNAVVALKRGSFPSDEAEAVSDAEGMVRFVNISEGKFGVLATELGTGLQGRASGTSVRDDEIAVVATLTASGRVSGTFVTTDGKPIPNAQIVLLSGDIEAFTITDANGRFELFAIPVGRFTVEGNDPIRGRLGRATGDLRFEGEVAEVTIVELPRGVVEGRVLQANGFTPVPGAEIKIQVDSFVPTVLQATTRPDGSFRFEGVSAGTFTLTATGPVSNFRGSATGAVATEGEVVTQDVLLEAFGALHVKVFGDDGAPVGNAEVELFGAERDRKGTVDTNGEFTFDFLKLGKYSLVATSLAERHNGGDASAELLQPGQTVDVEIHLRGVGEVKVKVVAADRVTPVASVEVTLTARAASREESPRPFGGRLLGFTDANGMGMVTFPGVAVGDFFVTAKSGPLGGVSDGNMPTPGAVVPITIQLDPAGSIHGRVLLPDGMTAAAQAFVTLRFTP